MNERKTEGSTGRRMVTLLLTRHHDPFSNYICHVSKSPYSHASISIDPEQKKFYSFNKKGFVEEYPGNRKRSNISMSIPVCILWRSIKYSLEERKHRNAKKENSD